MVDASNAAFTANFDSLGVDSTFMSKLKGADLDKVKMAVEATKLQELVLQRLPANWLKQNCMGSKKQEKVTALKDGLAAGKLEGDVTAKLQN